MTGHTSSGQQAHPTPEPGLWIDRDGDMWAVSPTDPGWLCLVLTAPAGTEVPE